DDGAGVAPDLHRVVLDPAGLGEDLLVLLLAGRDDLAGVVEDDRAGRGGALVDREDVLRRVGHRNSFVMMNGWWSWCRTAPRGAQEPPGWSGWVRRPCWRGRPGRRRAAGRRSGPRRSPSRCCPCAGWAGRRGRGADRGLGQG